MKYKDFFSGREIKNGGGCKGSRRRNCVGDALKAARAAAFGLTALCCFLMISFADEPAAGNEAGYGAGNEAQDTGQAAVAAGWLFQNEQWYYLEENGVPAVGWRAVDGSFYYFRADGTMATGVMKEGETIYTFAQDKGNVTSAKREKNSGGGSFPIGFYEAERQALADNLNELKEDAFDGDEDDDYYEDEKVNYDKEASFVISGRLTEIAEHRLSEARTKGYGGGDIPGEGNLDSYVKAIRYNSGRRFLEVYLKACDDAEDAENKLLRSHGSDEKKRTDRAVYYSEMGIAHEKVDGRDYYMVIFMK